MTSCSNWLHLYTKKCISGPFLSVGILSAWICLHLTTWIIGLYKSPVNSVILCCNDHKKHEDESIAVSVIVSPGIIGLVAGWLQ